MKIFIKNESNTLLSCVANLKFDKVMISRGFYDAKMICCVLNKHLSQFSLNFFVEDSKTTSVTFEYWFLLTQNLADGHAINHKPLNQFRKSSQSIYANYPVYSVKVKLTIYQGVACFLGFDNTEFVFQQQASGTVKAKEIKTMIKGLHVVDKSAGLNFMFFKCDKIKNVIVGFER